ncbi:MAG: hypothetical protein K2P10_03080 [Oscillospiraceae bacterium]|nr:hypothetical protein [Oscillospiraceae bacterium]
MRKKRTPWPRWAKVTRNLLLVLLLGVFIWDLLDKPLPHEAALRRLQRQYLIPETDRSIEVSRGYWGGSQRIDWNECAAMVSIQVQASPYNYDYPIVSVHRLTEGPDLLPLPWSTLLPGNAVGTMDIYSVYAAIEPPEDSATAELTLYSSKTLTVSGQKEDDIYIFYVPSESNDGQAACELKFYDADGELLDIVTSSDRNGAEP